MNTKIVYAVVSNEKDIYLEQTLLSVYSLRLYNPEAHVILVVDEDTNKTIQGKRCEILKYITEKIIVKVPKEYTQVQKSRYLKTTLRQNIKGDFLFVDSDTIITDSLSEIDNLNIELGAVKDLHVNLDQNYGCKNIIKKALSIGFNPLSNNLYFNSGVIYVKDTNENHSFFQQWNNEWTQSMKQFHEDQPSFNKVNNSCNNKISPINDQWNCQILCNGLPFLYNAKIIHYFNSWSYQKLHSPTYFFSEKTIFTTTKELGYIPQDYIPKIKNARGAFYISTNICSGTDVRFSNIWTVKVLKKLYIKYPHIFNILNSIFYYSVSPIRFIARTIK